MKDFITNLNGVFESEAKGIIICTDQVFHRSRIESIETVLKTFKVYLPVFTKHLLKVRYILLREARKLKDKVRKETTDLPLRLNQGKREGVNTSRFGI